MIAPGKRLPPRVITPALLVSARQGQTSDHSGDENEIKNCRRRGATMGGIGCSRESLSLLKELVEKFDRLISTTNEPPLRNRVNFSQQYQHLKPILASRFGSYFNHLMSISLSFNMLESSCALKRKFSSTFRSLLNTKSFQTLQNIGLAGNRSTLHDLVCRYFRDDRYALGPVAGWKT